MRSMDYWQGRLVRAEFRRKIVQFRLDRVWVVAVPTRRASSGRIRVISHAGWRKRYVHWLRRTKVRRELSRKLAYLDGRIAYYRERIEALSPVWVRLRQGVEL